MPVVFSPYLKKKLANTAPDRFSVGHEDADDETAHPTADTGGERPEKRRSPRLLLAAVGLGASIWLLRRRSSESTVTTGTQENERDEQ